MSCFGPTAGGVSDFGAAVGGISCFMPPIAILHHGHIIPLAFGVAAPGLSANGSSTGVAPMQPMAVLVLPETPPHICDDTAVVRPSDRTVARRTERMSTSHGIR